MHKLRKKNTRKIKKGHFADRKKRAPLTKGIRKTKTHRHDNHHNRCNPYFIINSNMEQHKCKWMRDIEGKIPLRQGFVPFEGLSSIFLAHNDCGRSSRINPWWTPCITQNKKLPVRLARVMTSFTLELQIKRVC